MKYSLFSLIVFVAILVYSDGVKIYTTKNDDYVFFPVNNEGEFKFKVMTDKSAWLSIGQTADIFNAVSGPYQLAIDRYGVLLKGSPRGWGITRQNITNLLTPTKFREFWLKWSVNGIWLGRENDDEPIFNYNQTLQTDINFIGINTLESPGVWIIKEKKDCNISSTSISSASELGRQLREQIKAQNFYQTEIASYLSAVPSRYEVEIEDLQINVKECMKRVIRLQEEIVSAELSSEIEYLREQYLKEKIYEKIKEDYYLTLKSINEILQTCKKN